MKYAKFLGSLLLALAILTTQAGVALAAKAADTPPLIGSVQTITLETDVNSAVTTVVVTLVDGNKPPQTVRINIESALALQLVIPDENGTPVLNPAALGVSIQIDPSTVIPVEEQTRHPVGVALAAFFPNIAAYDAIMKAHEEGVGFGGIAEALWLAQKMNGNADTFVAILEAKKSGDYSAFVLADGTIPQNWGQFKKAILEGGKNGNPGVVMSNKDHGSNNGNNTANPHGDGNDNNNGNGKGGGNGNGKDNGNNKDKGKGK